MATGREEQRRVSTERLRDVEARGNGGLILCCLLCLSHRFEMKGDRRCCHAMGWVVKSKLWFDGVNIARGH